MKFTTLNSFYHLLSISSLLTGSFSYYLVHDPNTDFTWFEAQSYCNSTYGTNLATAVNQSQLNELISMRDTLFGNTEINTFFGLNDLGNNEGVWSWISNIPCDPNANGTKCVTYWTTGEPNDFGTGEDCAIITYTDPITYVSNIRDVPCTQQENAFFCDPIYTTEPTLIPTYVPTYVPTFVPTSVPTYVPTYIPTYVPTLIPTYVPTTYVPTYIPTYAPFVGSTDYGKSEVDQNSNDAFVIVMIILGIIVFICVIILIIMIYLRSKKNRYVLDINQNKSGSQMAIIGSNVKTNENVSEKETVSIQPGSITSVSMFEETDNKQNMTTIYPTPQNENEIKEIKSWLSLTHGLTQYVDNFVENGYTDLEFIKKISSKDDLSEIGIILSAHQLTILDAINKLKNNNEYEEGKEGGIISKNTIIDGNIETNGNYIEVEHLNDDEFVVNESENENEHAEIATAGNNLKSYNHDDIDEPIVDDINKIDDHTTGNM